MPAIGEFFEAIALVVLAVIMIDKSIENEKTIVVIVYGLIAMVLLGVALVNVIMGCVLLGLG